MYFRVATETPLFTNTTKLCKSFLMLMIYPVLLDPTRRLENTQKFHLFDRNDVEMYHMTFVRKDIGMKMTNVSNRANYSMSLDKFVQEFEAWTPNKGILHPHPRILIVNYSIRVIFLLKTPIDYIQILAGFSPLLLLYPIISIFIWIEYAVPVTELPTPRNVQDA